MKRERLLHVDEIYTPTSARRYYKKENEGEFEEVTCIGGVLRDSMSNWTLNFPF